MKPKGPEVRTSRIKLLARKCGNERTRDACHFAALPDVAQTDVALNAVADEGAIESELITGLSIEARGRANLCQGKNGFGKSCTALKRLDRDAFNG